MQRREKIVYKIFDQILKHWNLQILLFMEK